MIHIALDPDDVKLVNYALRELMFKRLSDLTDARTEGAKEGARNEVEKLKSLLTRFHPEPQKERTTNE